MITKNAKKEFVKTLIFSAEANQKDCKVTFITPIGIITGERADMREYDISSADKHLESVRKHMEERGTVPVYELANSFYLRHKKEDEEKDIKYEDDGLTYHLKNVTIFSGDEYKHRVNTPYFTIFLDQVIGVISGEFDPANKQYT